jgi:hypothetical protein
MLHDERTHDGAHIPGYRIQRLTGINDSKPICRLHRARLVALTHAFKKRFALSFEAITLRLALRVITRAGALHRQLD